MGGFGDETTSNSAAEEAGLVRLRNAISLVGACNAAWGIESRREVALKQEEVNEGNVAVYLINEELGWGVSEVSIYALACVKMCLKTHWEMLQN